MILEVLAAGLLGAAVVVEGSSECPTPAAVQERLRPLLPPDDGRPGALAELVTEGEGLRVSLRRADGTAAGTRTLTGAHACDELADAVAVMIAAWQADLAAREPVPTPPAPAVVTAPPVVAGAAPAVAPGLRWELGAGAGVSSSGGDVAPAAVLLAGVSTGGALGLGLRAAVSGNREVFLPGGGASWRRALFAVGPRLRLSEGRAITEVHLGGGVSWLAIAASGFMNAQRHDDLVGGLEGGLRVAWNRARVQPWLEAGAAFWPVRSVLYQLPDERTATLPRFELLLTLGLSFSR